MHGYTNITAYNLSNISLSESSASIISDRSSFDESDSDEFTTREFHKEAVQTLERAISDGHTVEIALLELNTLRLASNTNFHDLRVVAVPTVISRIDVKKGMAGTKEVS